MTALSAPSVSGTFSGTGASAALRTRRALIWLSASGNITVDIEVSVDGTNYATHSTVTNADGVVAIDFFADVLVRLNCTAHTADADYEIVAGAGER